MLRYFAAYNERNHHRYIPYIQLLPYNLHSVTHHLTLKSPLTGCFELDKNRDLIRIQSYCPNMRSVHGYGGVQKVGEQLMDIRTLVKEVGESDQSYVSLDDGARRSESWVKLAQSHIDKLRTDNGIARLELTFKTTSLEDDKVLEEGFKTLINTFHQNTKVYSASLVANLAEISLLAFEGVSNALFSWFQGNYIPNLLCWNVFAEVWQYLTFVGSNFFSGRSSYNSKAFFTPRLGYLFCRPYINPTWDGINAALNKVCYNEAGLSMFKKDWFDKGGVICGSDDEIKGINSMIINKSGLFLHRFQSFLNLLGTKCNSVSVSVLDVIACKQCKRITSKVKSTSEAWINHPCIPSQDLTSQNCELTSQFFKDYLYLLSQALSLSQIEALEAILGCQQNCFLTGVAGCGKSFLLKIIYPSLIVKYSYPTVCMTATTNIAASNVNGITLYAFMGLEVTTLTNCMLSVIGHEMERHLGDHINGLQKNKKKIGIIQRAQLCEILIIDEAGMVDQRLFELLDMFLRVMKSCRQPFGGVRVILVGDVLQLPPIESSDKKRDINGVHFFFESNLLWDTFFIAYLRENHRQNDPDFLKALNQVRIGDSTVISYLNDRIFNNNSASLSTLEIASKKFHEIRKRPNSIKNKLAANLLLENRNNPKYYLSELWLNRLKSARRTGYSDLIVCLEKTEAKVYTDLRSEDLITYTCESSGTRFSYEFPTDLFRNFDSTLRETLEVYVGMPCKITYKTQNPNIVSNTLVEIVEIIFDSIQKNSVQSIKVKTTSLDFRTLFVTLTRVTIREMFNGKEASRTQFPIISSIGLLPWNLQCLTIPQNIFYDNTTSSTSKKSNKGLLYAVMSRAKKSDQLSFLYPFVAEEISNGVNLIALQFDNKFRLKPDVIFNLYG